MALFARIDAEAGAEKNVFYSPVSVEQAFGLLHAGAAGETRAQIERFFGWPQGEAADMLLARQRSGLLDHGTQADIRLANALWLSKGWQFGPGYTGFARQWYGARVSSLDFSPGLPSQQSARIINDWAAEETGGLITDIITPDQLADSTAALLTNALYFNANWKTELGYGEERSFLFGDGTDRPFTFMREQDGFAIASEGGWSAVRMPYVGDRFAMDVIMPDKRKVVATAPGADVLAALNGKLTAANPSYVDLQLPRFEIDNRNALTDSLKAIGLTLPFDPYNADLSGMTDGAENGLYVSEAYQITKLQVYEQGTKAAAVTVLRIVPVGGRIIREKPTPFIVDRPFTVVIRDLKEGTILFVGRIADPQPFEPQRDEDY